MAKIYKSLVELIGRTPLLELKNYSEQHDLEATLLGKLEYFNPAGSVKDRIAKAFLTLSLLLLNLLVAIQASAWQL